MQWGNLFNGQVKSLCFDFVHKATKALSCTKACFGAELFLLFCESRNYNTLPKTGKKFIFKQPNNQCSYVLILGKHRLL